MSTTGRWCSFLDSRGVGPEPGDEPTIQGSQTRGSTEAGATVLYFDADIWFADWARRPTGDTSSMTCRGAMCPGVTEAIEQSEMKPKYWSGVFVLEPSRPVVRRYLRLPFG